MDEPPYTRPVSRPLHTYPLLYPPVPKLPKCKTIRRHRHQTIVLQDQICAQGFPFSSVEVRLRLIFFYAGFGPFEAIVLIKPGNQRCNQTKTLPWVVKI